MAGDTIAVILGRINQEISQIEGRTLAGALAAGLKVEALAKKRVPVEYGSLRASGYTKVVDRKSVEVGFSSEYAVYVHENREMKLKGKPRRSGLGVYWGPHGQSRFLASALEDLSEEIVSTIAEHVKVD